MTQLYATTLLTSKELASELNVSESWVRDHAHGRRRPVINSQIRAFVEAAGQPDYQRAPS